MTAIKTREEQKDWYLSQFRLFESSLNGDAGQAIHSLRTAAIERFSELGFPTSKSEEWKYTNLASIVSTPFRLALGKADVPAGTLDGIPFPRLVFVNGTFSREYSSTTAGNESLTMASLPEAAKFHPELIRDFLGRYADVRTQAFSALNTAFLYDGAFILVRRGAVIEEPVQLVFISTDREEQCIAFPRVLIIAEENSQVKIVERFKGTGGNTYFNNIVGETILGPNAVVDHYRIQQESENAYHVSHSHVHQDRGSVYSSTAFLWGAALSRHEVRAVLNGEGGECRARSLYLGKNRQHSDIHTVLEHAAPRCQSHQLVKTMVDDEAHGVFSGRIVVHPDAQKTNAIQTNNNLLLSESAAVDTKPQLEIFADDVRCTHGATIGKIDEEGLFYLRSRGIDEQQARNVLTYAFASEVLESVAIDDVRREMDERLHRQFRF